MERFVIVTVIEKKELTPIQKNRLIEAIESVGLIVAPTGCYVMTDPWVKDWKHISEVDWLKMLDDQRQ